jgi:hypothetical protein
MMLVTQEMIVEAKRLAQDNYGSWGQYVVECYEDSELAESLESFDTLEDWIEVRIVVAEVYAERKAFYE